MVYLMQKNFYNLETPCHIFDLDRLNENLKIINTLCNETNCKVLYALKGCSQQNVLSYISTRISGACVGSLNELKLAKKFNFKEIHTYSPIFKQNEILEISELSNAVIFNSINQFETYKTISKRNKAICGLRINPQYSEIRNIKINPCAPHSRFGVDVQELNKSKLRPEYIHFHSMCEQYSDTLERTLNIIAKIYDNYIDFSNTLNIGGGQLYTDPKYNLSNAISSINWFKEKYNQNIVIEPCEAILYNVGYLVGSVIDIIHGELDTLILDLSAVCHIPDIVFSGYNYKIIDAFEPYKEKYTYRIAGPTCYSGDIFGDFSFEHKLSIGSKIIFCDTAHYTSVKSSMFNGVSLPSIISYSKENGFVIEKKYSFSLFELVN